ncbi:MAG: alpha/beta hydrolase [Alphaproteobacteria bacterium]|nr:alpha/beta hydrolase [Alphaproteobacteria bacterium]MCB9698605.1 alpha/beta hydrolase [Alphaproteobacteria bacterium]
MSTTRRVRTNGIELEVRTLGPEDGPMVLMLHGFPECAHGWMRQAPALAEQGWFCVLPDQRGYGRSDKPPRLRDYRMGVLVDDARGLIDAFGRPKAHVVCHDWGGAVGWTLATTHPERVATLSALNMPHPGVMARHLRTPKQLRRSWYMFAFLLPRLPERAMTRDDHAELVRALFANTVRKAYSPEDLAAYREVWSQPGALSAMLRWYRAALLRPTIPALTRCVVPTQIVFGQQDRALDWQMAVDSAALCDDVALHLIEDAAHFVQHDVPERVTRLLLDFLGAHPDDATRRPSAASTP